MNTVEKGDSLENKVYRYFLDLIEKNDFYAKKECCKIFQKKGYYSSDRGKDIIFDVAIEIYLPNETEYSSLVLIECKNYEKPIPVDQIEAFYTKVQQVSSGKVTSMMISNNSFQAGTFAFAESKKIALARYYDREGLDWVLHRSPSSLVQSGYALNQTSNAYRAIHQNEFKSSVLDFYGYVNQTYISSTRLFFGALLKQGRDKVFVEKLALTENQFNESRSAVDFREKTDIAKLAQNTLVDISYESGEVSLHKVVSFLEEEKGLVLQEDAVMAEGVLGEITFEPLVIKISSNIDSPARERFTLAHELGHFILGHSKYMASESVYDDVLDIEKIPKFGVKDIERMEWQANQFAACLLLPEKQFIYSFKRLAALNGLYDRGFGVLYLDNQRCNRNIYMMITSELMREYNVSRQVVKIKLKELGFLNEEQSK